MDQLPENYLRCPLMAQYPDRQDNRMTNMLCKKKESIPHYK